MLLSRDTRRATRLVGVDVQRRRKGGGWEKWWRQISGGLSGPSRMRHTGVVRGPRFRAPFLRIQNEKLFADCVHINSRNPRNPINYSVPPPTPPPSSFLPLQPAGDRCGGVAQAGGRALQVRLRPPAPEPLRSNAMQLINHFGHSSPHLIKTKKNKPGSEWTKNIFRRVVSGVEDTLVFMTRLLYLFIYQKSLEFLLRIFKQFCNLKRIRVPPYPAIRATRQVRHQPPCNVLLPF